MARLQVVDRLGQFQNDATAARHGMEYPPGPVGPVYLLSEATTPRSCENGGHDLGGILMFLTQVYENATP